MAEEGRGRVRYRGGSSGELAAEGGREGGAAVVSVGILRTVIAGDRLRAVVAGDRLHTVVAAVLRAVIARFGRRGKAWGPRVGPTIGEEILAGQREPPELEL
uniref:Uncharacterized protein n=1 Tax=Oryza glumipatula TaxID=40148 RepID=A0A0D9YB52_9ORYZ